MNKQLALCCIIFALVVSFSTFFIAHKENDEQVYLTLAKRITCQHSRCFLFDFKQYNLLGSTVLKSLVDPEYHSPVFFHPPAFIMALSLAYRIGGEIGMKMVPILAYLLIAYIIYKIIILLEVAKKTAEYGLFLSLCSPLLLFNSQKIWMDLFMCCMLIISFYFLLHFVKRKNIIMILLSGLFFFLSVFTKYWALVSFVPFTLFLIVQLRRKSIVPLILFILPLLLLIVNIVFKIIPISSHPLLNSLFSTRHSPYPFIEYVTHRSFFYYFLSMFAINPVYLYIGFTTKDVFNCILNERSFIRFVAVFLLCCILYFLVIFSIFGLSKAGFQTRYIVFIEPFLILLASLLIEKSKNKEFSLLFLFLIHNILLVLINAVFLNTSELFPFIEMFTVF